MPGVRLILALHNHQPVGNFDGVFEASFRESYLPFLEVMEEYPGIPFVLHTSGPLVEWLAENRPEYIQPYLKVLGQLEKTQPDDPLVQAALGRKDLKDGNFQAAADHLRHALQSNLPAATTYADLADALANGAQPAVHQLSRSPALMAWLSDSAPSSAS